jgi:hypothetical protein
VLRAAGRDDDAEQWAHNGLAEHPSGFQADGLRDQLVDLLLDGGRGAEAVAVRGPDRGSPSRPPTPHRAGSR